MSDKQVAYATNLRTKFVAQNAKLITDAITTRDDPEKQAAIAAAAEKEGMTIADFARAALNKYPYNYLYEAYICVNSNEAREIIDALTAR